MSAPEPPVWTLLGQLQARLETVLVSNGYRTDIGTTVVRELEQLDCDLDELPLPCIALAVDDEMLLAELNTQRQQRTFTIVAEAYLQADATNAQQTAHEAAEDLAQALPAKTRFEQGSGVVSDVHLEGITVARRPEGAPLIVVAARLSVLMQGNRAAPAVPPEVPPP